MKHTLCDYCHGIGACPQCWGRSAIDLLREQNKELLEALRSARGTMGYGPLTMLPKTIKKVREILYKAIQYAEGKR